MPLQNFVANSTPKISAAWLNLIDAFYVTLFQSATTAAQARTAIGAAASGANTDITSLTGTTTNDSAAAGKIGEVITSTVLLGSAISLSAGTVANITTLSLTAGDWDLFGVIAFSPGATTSVTQVIGSFSPTSATLATTPEQAKISTAANVMVTDTALAMPTTRVSLAAPATYYLVARAIFTVSTMVAYGRITARRAR